MLGSFIASDTSCDLLDIIEDLAMGRKSGPGGFTVVSLNRFRRQKQRETEENWKQIDNFFKNHRGPLSAPSKSTNEEVFISSL